jgi:hypothetical protein
MKQVTLYSGCSFDYGKRSGRYFAALEYKNSLKRIYGEIQGEHETANRVVIHGLIEAVKLIKEPCELTFITCTPVGFKTKNSPNIDLIMQLKNMVSEKGCTYEYDEILKCELDKKTFS